MSHEITLAQAAECAHQVEVLCHLIEDMPHQLAESEISAIATLLKRLSGDVCVWLFEEMDQREKKA